MKVVCFFNSVRCDKANPHSGVCVHKKSGNGWLESDSHTMWSKAGNSAFTVVNFVVLGGERCYTDNVYRLCSRRGEKVID